MIGFPGTEVMFVLNIRMFVVLLFSGLNIRFLINRVILER